MAEVRAKVSALAALSGERVDWGYSRAWERDYLANVSLSLGNLCMFVFMYQLIIIIFAWEKIVEAELALKHIL